MDKETRTALEKSIAKWEAIAAGTGTDEGPDNCALCVEFCYDGCVGCPIAERTGQIYCNGTPYDQWSVAEWHFGKKANTPEEKQQAQAMLDFLKSLLPDNLEK